jgi:PAS domain S-box-containing protein
MEGDSTVARCAGSAPRSMSTKRVSGLLGDDHEIEAYVREFLETLPGIISIASPGGQLEYVNHEILEMIGVPFAEIAGTEWLRFLHPDDAKGALKEWVRRSTAGLPFKYCLRVQTRDGTYRWCQSSVKPLFDEKGEIVRYYGYLSDLDALLSRRGGDIPSRQPVRREGQRSNERPSARECAVLALIAKGQSNKLVAQTLKITPETVKSHLRRTFVKLGSKTRAEAVARATELGFLVNLATLPVSSYGSASKIVDHRPSLTAMNSARKQNEISKMEAV